MPYQRIGFVSIGLMMLTGLFGCAGFERRVVESAMGRLLPGQPVVNSYHFSRWPTGTWAALSVWQVKGAPGQSITGALQTLGQYQAGPNLLMSFVTGSASHAGLSKRLDASAADCPSLNLQLQAAATLLSPWVARWFDAAHMPQIVVLVVPPMHGSSGFRMSTAQAVPDLELRMAVQLPESDACIWRRHWVIESLGTVLHEAYHFDRFRARGQSPDRLQEEFVAYAIGDCVRRAIEGPNARLERSFPGLDHRPVDEVLRLVDDGRLPPTIAARFLGHLYADPSLDRSIGDPESLHCESLIHVDPDPRAMRTELERRRLLAFGPRP